MAKISRRKLIVSTGVLLAFSVAAFLIVHPGGGGTSAAAGGVLLPSKPAQCRTGAIYRGKPKLPAGDKVSRELVLGCGRARFVGLTVVVGVRTRDSVCVAVIVRRSQELHGGACKNDDLTWKQIICGNKSAAGCIAGYTRTATYTEMAGVVPLDIKGLAVTKDGKSVGGLLTVARVRGRLQDRLQSPDSFAYFALQIPGCWNEKDLVIRTIDQSGANAGIVAKWLGPAPRPCPTQT
jgi:hypothetical protein